MYYALRRVKSFASEKGGQHDMCSCSFTTLDFRKHSVGFLRNAGREMLMREQISTPFDKLIPIAELVCQDLPVTGEDVSNRRRKIATKWLAELFESISDFHWRCSRSCERIRR
jgi:hypothetical protein